MIIARGQVCAAQADTCLWLEAGDILIVAAGGIGRYCWREEARLLLYTLQHTGWPPHKQKPLPPRDIRSAAMETETDQGRVGILDEPGGKEAPREDSC